MTRKNFWQVYARYEEEEHNNTWARYWICEDFTKAREMFCKLIQTEGIDGVAVVANIVGAEPSIVLGYELDFDQDWMAIPDWAD